MSPRMKSRKTWSEIPESSTSELFLPLTKEYAKQPAMPSMLQKKPDVSSALTRIFVRHYGNLWMTQRQRSNTALANAIFWKSQITKLNSCSELQTMTRVPHFWKRNTTFRLSLSHWEKTEAALTTKTWKWRLLLSFRKRLSRQQVQAIPSAQVP